MMIMIVVLAIIVACLRTKGSRRRASATSLGKCKKGEGNRGRHKMC